ncbi:MAG TPA: amidohydrolase family protein [Actinomycetota bacterium]|nr:amidohydrolase family protein [Actinomycetota bacterium]
MGTLLIQARRAWLGRGRVLDDPAVVLDGGRIRWVGPARHAGAADQEVEGDWFLMPGPVDHHVHLGLSDPRAVLRGGVTAVRDLGWPPEDIFPLVDAASGPGFEGPAVAACGPMITGRGGYPSRASWAPAGTALEVEGTEEAVAAVERVVAQDPAAIKVTLNAEAGPTLTDDELVAIVDTAHRLARRVTCHVQGAGQTERALGAGVDELAHAPWTERLSEAMIAGLARSTTIVGTLDIHSYGRSTPELEVAQDNLRRFRAAGGRILYGTDLGNGPIPPGLHAQEARHLAACGLSNEEVLLAMTAHELVDDGRGDLIGLRADPLDDPAALRDPPLVVRSGRIRRLDR